MDKEILVLGDFTHHHMLVPHPDKEGKYRGYVRWTGAPLVKRMICHALIEPADPRDRLDELLSHCPCKPGFNSNSVIAEHVNVLDHFPIGASSKSHETVLRVRSSYDVADVEYPPPDRQPIIADDASSKEPHILVVYDCASQFRANLAAEKLRMQIESSRVGAVIAVRDEIKAWIDKYYHVLKAKSGATARSNRTVLLVTADALRKCGLNIPKYASIEQVVKILSRFRNIDPIESLLAVASHLIITFDETGSVYINAVEKTEGSIHYCPNFDARALVYRQQFGFMPGKYTTFLTALVKELCEADRCREWEIARAAKLGTIAYNFSFKQGLARRDDFNIENPFDALERSLGLEQRRRLEKLNEENDNEFLLTSLAFKPDRGVSWHRINVYIDGFEANQDAEYDKVAVDIVIRGIEETSRIDDSTLKSTSFPRHKIKSPYAQFGSIKLIDHEEIDGFHNIRTLMGKYLETPEWAEPLSIAVFGQPGSGKSFAVKQILRSLRPESRSEPLSFNLAQFSSVDQLTEAFHRVQDRALEFKEVPLVIFDEFDTYFEGDLGWLKYFLAPMQDGLFRGRTGDYRVGRAIFLFSGGISPTFEEFRSQHTEKSATNLQAAKNSRNLEKANSKEIESIRLKEMALRRSKHTDFVSRLRGHLNVKGINPKDGEKVDPLLKLRRAILLRSLLERHAGPILVTDKNGKNREIRIDEKVVKAFLNTKEYWNGIRSMEAIVQTSTWFGEEFVVASLPAQGQMESHAQVEAFLKLMDE